MLLEQVFQLSPTTLALSQIYLDPNNPRFAEDGRPRVSDDMIDSDAIQSELMSKLEREFAVDRLKDSIEVNGYLPIDRIVVRQFKDEKYVVLEGNRRLTAAKRLLELHAKGSIRLESRIAETLDEIPLLIYTGSDPDAAWIFQGIRHISNAKEWSAYNKAKLLVDQMGEQNLGLSEVGKIFGISGVAAGQWTRAYNAYLQVKDHPDFHRDVSPALFPFLQELFGRSNIALKSWLGWSDTENKLTESENLSEFLQWMYPKLSSEGEFDPDLPGDWEKRRIPRAIDLRGVSKLISKYPEEFVMFRQSTTSLSLVLGRIEAKEAELAERAEDLADQLDVLYSELDRLPIVQIKREGKQAIILEKVRAIESVLHIIITSLEQ